MNIDYSLECSECGREIRDEVHVFATGEVCCSNCAADLHKIYTLYDYLEELEYQAMCNAADDKYDDV